MFYGKETDFICSDNKNVVNITIDRNAVLRVVSLRRVTFLKKQGLIHSYEEEEFKIILNRLQHINNI